MIDFTNIALLSHIWQARRLEQTEGGVTIWDLLTICERKRPVLPPWKQDQEDRQFTGYVDLSEMLTHMEVDVRKVMYALRV